MPALKNSSKTLQTRSRVKISRILHAGYFFECEDQRILFDPIFENPFSLNCHAFPNVEFDLEEISRLDVDAVFISHYHDDHCSFQSLRWLKRDTSIYLYCVFEELFSMLRELGFSKVIPLTLNKPVSIGPMTVIPRRALDADVDSLFHVKVGDLNILNVVDSWIDYDTLDLLVREGPWDMIMWPFQTMRELEVLIPSRSSPADMHVPEEWVEQLAKLNPRYLVPSSCQFSMEPWSWYNHAFFPISYRQFAADMTQALPKTEIVRMNPSVAVELTQESLQPAPSLRWIKPVGRQDVDYEYLPNLVPPSTADIAQKFGALTEDQWLAIKQFLDEDILQKYSQLPQSECDYFQTERYWQLRIYDNRGGSLDYYYNVCGQSLQKAPPASASLAWLTEVPAIKLYSALQCGEALTSLYMRINDISFSESVERDLEGVDPVEDPLIRCLFSGIFGAYQAQQLQKIKAEPLSTHF